MKTNINQITNTSRKLIKIQVKINDIQMVGFLDPGSNTTLMANSSRHLIVGNDFKEDRQTAKGFTGQQFQLHGSAIVRWLIGNKGCKAPLTFTDDEFFTNKDYSVLIGNDVLERFDKITIDYKNEKIIIDKEAIPFLNTSSKANKKLRAHQEANIPPYASKRIQCYWKNDQDSHKIYLVETPIEKIEERYPSWDKGECPQTWVNKPLYD